MDPAAIFAGNDGEATRAMYACLGRLGAVGAVALNLFRAQKCSTRAKLYRGGNGKGSFREQAYGRKEFSLRNLTAELTTHADALGIVWGWKEDPAQPVHRWVLYVVLPAGFGQVSFHHETPMGNHRFEGEWDGSHAGAQRIVAFVGSVLNPESAPSVESPSAP